MHTEHACEIEQTISGYTCAHIHNEEHQVDTCYQPLISKFLQAPMYCSLVYQQCSAIVDIQESELFWHSWLRQAMPKQYTAYAHAVSGFAPNNMRQTLTTKSSKLLGYQAQLSTLRKTPHLMTSTLSQVTKGPAYEWSGDVKSRTCGAEREAWSISDSNWVPVAWKSGC